MVGDIWTTGKVTPKRRIQGLGTYGVGTYDRYISAYHMCVHRHHGCVHTHIGTHIYLVAKNPLGQLGPAQRWVSLAGQGDGEKEEGKGGGGRESWGQVSGEVELPLGPRGYSGPLSFLGTRSLPGQLESSLPLGLCPPTSKGIWSQENAI